MENHLSYKEYFGSVKFSVDDAILYGEIIGINDLVTYEAETIKELQSAFQYAVEDYLETCETLGKVPHKFYKGSFNVRTSTKVHTYLAILAQRKQMKLNEIVNKA